MYVNNQWCSNFKVRTTVCNSNIELLCVSFRPYYLPREFNQVHIFLVYIRPDADANEAAGVIYDIVQRMEDSSPDSPKFILGDFNHCNLSGTFPHYFQYVDEATRGDNILDRCYGSVKDAYKSIIRPGSGRSDHDIVHLLPKYKQKLKTEKPREKAIRI